MKVRFSSRLLGSALFIVGVAPAFGQVSYYLAYGDSNLVGLAKNSSLGGGARDANAAVGAEIPMDRAMRVPVGGAKFKVQVWARFGSQDGPNGTLASNSGCIFLGFDRGVTGAAPLTAAGFTAAAQAHKIKATGSYMSDPAMGLPGLDSKGATVAANLTRLGTLADLSLSGCFGFGSTLRPIGLAGEFGFGVGRRFNPEKNHAYRLLDINLNSDQLQADEIYGDDAAENGLSLDTLASATSRSNFFVLDGTKAQSSAFVIGKPKYAVQGVSAVPEPASVLAIAVGTLVCFRRRTRRG